MQTFKTADLYDVYAEKLQVCEPLFQHYGGHKSFFGPIATLKCFEDNTLVGVMVDQPGKGRVLVVDAGGSRRCAMLGDRLAQKAVDNGWAGVLMFGCVRDSVDIGHMPIGVLALATTPRKSVKKGVGESGESVQFAGVTFNPGEWLYADEDGAVVLAEAAAESKG
ncbi:regulator of ribonuclease activity A [Desulfuromusa kysingii]|uniref:4-hydroxy-4-methyl-2-oxoglutarate aldolase n=1 Tax=Desulfuromusa kysingii TaxID=37625 RepID=A0A1H4DWJ9_9BACT|nr:ribonuclease E activity regulator RraA [Desulfuromusa kysingii]SEA77153.1 regulator of ribonuclease activity A [Desulfuromusa kysingii]